MHAYSKWGKSWVIWVLLSCFAAVGASAAETSNTQLPTMKLNKRFGIGVAAGGALAVMGLEADINLTESVSISGGVGTGLNYSTFMLKTRYFLLGQWVSPYLGFALARWWTEGTNATRVGPAILSEKFLAPGYDLTRGFNLFLVSPSFGVQFMHPMGFAVSVELQYLFRLFDFANGTYAGMSAHWYF